MDREEVGSSMDVEVTKVMRCGNRYAVIDISAFDLLSESKNVLILFVAILAVCQVPNVSIEFLREMTEATYHTVI